MPLINTQKRKHANEGVPNFFDTPSRGTICCSFMNDLAGIPMLVHALCHCVTVAVFRQVTPRIDLEK